MFNDTEWVVDRLSGPTVEFIFFTTDDNGAINKEYRFNGINSEAPRVGQYVKLTDCQNPKTGKYVNEGRHCTAWEGIIIIEGEVEEISHDFEREGSGPKDVHRQHFVYIKVKESTNGNQS